MTGDLLSTGWHDPYPEELIDGEIMRLLPGGTNHSIISGNISMIFESYLRRKRPEIVMRRFDVYLTGEDRFIPDVMVICDRDKIQEDGVYGAPDLVVEVLSPSTAKNDRKRKNRSTSPAA